MTIAAMGSFNSFLTHTLPPRMRLFLCLLACLCFGLNVSSQRHMARYFYNEAVEKQALCNDSSVLPTRHQKTD
mgnify:CR=1 FL=1